MEYERLKAYARLEGFTEGKAQGQAEGRAQGQAEANLKNAIIAVKEFNQTPEIVAEKFSVSLVELQKALAE